MSESQQSGTQSAAVIERDAAVMSPSYVREAPFVMSHGKGSEVWDVDGKRYIDFNAGIAVCATGHCHPDVLKAIQDQASKFLHVSTDFYQGILVDVAEKLNEIVPGDERKRVFFTNSGTESVEAALKLARYTSHRPRIMAFIGAFHGRSMGSLSLTGSRYVQRRGFAPLVPGVTHIPYGYCYRCAYNLTYPECDIHCVNYIEETVFRHYVPADEVAAIFVEPIQGEGGYIVPPPGYFQRLKQLCEKYGILFVADEIQSGIGRTGKMFAIEHWDVAPDIVCMAKGIASGMPLGAMVARESLMTWGPGAHGTTFGGNPVACAAALETIRLVQGGYMDNAARMGDYILNWLHDNAADHPSVGDIRGKGLMIGIELVEDRQTKELAGDLRNRVVELSHGKGLVLLSCGPSTVRFMPALNISQDLVDEGLRIFQEALAEAEAEAGL